MVFPKKLNYGSRGHKIPAVPQVPKSARGKRSVRKKVEGSQMCAFDLLATVAGNLLLEGQCSVLPQVTTGTLNLSTKMGVIKQEQQVDDEKLPCSDRFDHHSNIECSRPGPEVISGQQTADKLKKDDSLAFSATTSEPKCSFINSIEVHCGMVSAEPLTINSNKGEVGSHFTANSGKCTSFSGCMESNEFEGMGSKIPPQAEHLVVKNVIDDTGAKIYSSMGAVDLDTQLPFAASYRSVEVPLCRNSSHPGSLQKDAVGVELSVYKDDDENSSGCTDCSIPNSKTTRVKQIVGSRVRKPLVPKYWKSASRIMRHDPICDYDVISKSVLRNKKMCYIRQRKQRGSFKRRKFVDRYSSLTSTGLLSTLCNKSGLKLEQSDFQDNKTEAIGTSSFAAGKNSTYDSSDYHVKLRIKSFKVPELYIDIPETATVGSLKQTVMEAVTAILQGGLHVGVLLRGKKVKDDSKTLRQAGISQVDELDSVDFTLEPNSLKTASLTSREDPDSFGITGDAEPLARMPPVAPAAVDRGASDSTPQPVLTFCHESDHDSVHSPTDTSLLDKSKSDSQVLVTVSPLNAETLAVVPMRRSRQSEAAQRRLRRPFTVAEVEALVQAVEKFGTGRWRDVKVRAFDNAKHRTYVDLKDKWKTLVHTAKISPQQRRGEPVPQVLLDRVLSAHSFWSHQQTKLQVKSSRPHLVDPLSAL